MRFRAALVAAMMSGLAACSTQHATGGREAEAPAFAPRFAAVAEASRPRMEPPDLLSMQMGAEEIKHQRALTLFNLAMEKAEKALQEGAWEQAILRANEAASVVDENREALWGTEITELRGQAARALAAAEARQRISGGLRPSGAVTPPPIPPKQLAAQVAAAEKRREIRTLREEARAFAENRRFIEAIDTLRQLLAVEPRDAEAQAELRRLEDITSLRTYDQLRRQQAREATGAGVEAKESAVPYGGTVTYPSDWVEKSRQRQ